jgi:hypothetical protein
MLEFVHSFGGGPVRGWQVMRAVMLVHNGIFFNDVCVSSLSKQVRRAFLSQDFASSEFEPV